ncbi:MAG: tetratricopeptide repeat protein [Planctomycetota bacterium]
MSRTGLLRALLLALAACGAPPATPRDRMQLHPEGGARQATEAERAELDAARRLLDEGRPAAARDRVQALLATQRELAEAHELLGRALLELLPEGELPFDAVQDCEAQLLIAIRLQPRGSQARWNLGRLYEREGHLEAALDAYREALRFNVNFKPALLSAARIATRLGEEREAVRHLEALRALPPVPFEVVALEARCYLTLGDAVDQDPDNQRAYLERAMAAFSEQRERFPESWEGPEGMAYCLVRMASKGFVEADRGRITELFLEAARLHPTSPEPGYNLGLFLASDLVGDRRAAIENYRKALERDPGHEPTLLNLAALLWEDEAERDEARALYRRVLPGLRDPRERRQVEERLR